MTLRGTRKDGYPGRAEGPPKRKKKTTKVELGGVVLVQLDGTTKEDVLVVRGVLDRAFGHDKVAVSKHIKPWLNAVNLRLVIKSG